jgi:hypothetical protein
MARHGLVLVLLLAAGGCAARSPKRPDGMGMRPTYEDAPAAALVFDSPVTLNEPPIFLPRDQRQPGAFVGFDELTITYQYLRTDDRHTNDGTDRYIRRSVSERIGVSYR